MKIAKYSSSEIFIK